MAGGRCLALAYLGTVLVYGLGWILLVVLALLPAATELAAQGSLAGLETELLTLLLARASDFPLPSSSFAE